MPPAPYAESLRRFARDLSALRESQGVSIERIHQDSKIPLHVLRDFEADALQSNPVFNRVYLRSLVKTYADALHLPPSELMAPLERAYSGQYDGSGTLGGKGKVPLESLAAQPDTSVVLPEEADDPSPDAKASSVTAATAGASSDGGAVALSDSGRRVASSYSTVQTAGPTTPAGQAFSGTYGATVETRRVPGWALVLLSVLGLLAVIGGIVWWLSRSPAGDSAPVRGDSTATAAGAPAQAPTAQPAAAPQLPVALPDTLVLTVRAASGPLRGIRIRLDADDRRPYWIEQGEARTFRFRDSAFVTSRTPAAAFLLNGSPLDTAAVRAADGSLRITRAGLSRR